MAVDIAAALELLERYGYLIVFIAGFAEAVPLLGLLIPGQAVIVLAGAVAAGGHLSLPLIFLAAVPAGILGDALGYYIGRHYGRDLLVRHGPRLRITDAHLARSDAMFRKWGVFALVLGRFSFLTRGIVPLLGGMSRVRQALFWPVNVLGAILWAGAYAVLGYFFGAAWLRLEGVLGRILAITAVVVVGLYVLYRVLKRYADQFTKEDLYVALLGIAGGTVFGVLADRVEKLGRANRLDEAQPVMEGLLAPARGFLTALEPLGSYAAVGLVTLGIMAVLAWRGRAWEATLCGMGMGGIILLVEVLQPVFGRAFGPGGEAFPGSNAALALVFAGIITYLVSFHVRPVPVVVATVAITSLFCGAVGLAPLSRGAEMPTDFLAGLALGLTWLSVSILVVEWGLKRTPRPRHD